MKRNTINFSKCKRCACSENTFSMEPCSSCEDGSKFTERSCENCYFFEKYMPECRTCVERSEWRQRIETDSSEIEDAIGHPKHYEGTTSIQYIEVMQVAYGANNTALFCLMNAFKYLWRYKNKNGLEDLKKAEKYLEFCRMIDPGENDYFVRRADEFEKILKKHLEEFR